MIYSKQQNFNNFIFFIILLSILLCCSTISKAQSNPLLTQYITTCEPNKANSVIFQFNSSDTAHIDASNTDNFEIKDQLSNEKGIQLKKELDNDNFTFELIFDSANTKIIINGNFVKSCENSYTSSCTVIIAFLASLCLILFTALALALIILRRKKPITFKFGQQSQRDSDGSHFNSSNEYEQNVNESRKESTFDVSNGVLGNIKSVTPVIETTPTYPRKSSLKPPKNGNLSEQISNNNYKKSGSKIFAKANSSHDNAAYNGNDLFNVEEEKEDKTNTELKVFQEIRRKSIVTFSEKTDEYG